VSATIVWHARQPLGGIVGRALSNAAVVYVGRISYGVYLYHLIIPGVVSALGVSRLPGIWRLFEAGSWLGFFTHCALTIAVASVSFHFFEMPIRRLADPASGSRDRVGQALTR